MAEQTKTIKQASPLFFPKFSAAFKPFKKRANSVSTTPKNNIHVNETNNQPGQNKKRDKKAENKATDGKE